MHKESILKLIKSAECKSAEEIKLYAQACIELDVIKMIDGQMTVNMRSVISVTDFIIQGNDPDILVYIRKCFTGSTRILGGLVTHLKFNKDWRKLQSEWGKMAPYLKVFTNGMYIPFNKEILGHTLELLEAYNNYALVPLVINEILDVVIVKYKEIDYEEVVEAIGRELGIN